MELLVAALGATALWAYYKRLKSQSETSEPPPGSDPPPVKPPVIIKAELLHQVYSIGIRECDGTYEVKPLDSRIFIDSSLLDGPLLAWWGNAQINSDGTYFLAGKTRREFTTYDTIYEGKIRAGEVKELDRKFLGSNLFGVPITVGETLSLRAS